MTPVSGHATRDTNTNKKGASDDSDKSDKNVCSETPKAAGLLFSGGRKRPKKLFVDPGKFFRLNIQTHCNL